MIDDVIDRYIAMRDRKAELKAEFDEKVEALTEGMKKCENFILAHLVKTGQTTAGTASGTAFISEVKSVTVADPEEFKNYLFQSGNWHMADIRAAKNAIVEFKDEHQDLPPGINYREEKVVRFRKPTTK